MATESQSLKQVPKIESHAELVKRTQKEGFANSQRIGLPKMAQNVLDLQLTIKFLNQISIVGI